MAYWILDIGLGLSKLFDIKGGSMSEKIVVGVVRY